MELGKILSSVLEQSQSLVRTCTEMGAIMAGTVGILITLVNPISPATGIASFAEGSAFARIAILGFSIISFYGGITLCKKEVFDWMSKR